MRDAPDPSRTQRNRSASWRNLAAEQPIAGHGESAYRESIAIRSHVLRLEMRRLAMYGRDSLDDVPLIGRIAARDAAAFAPLYDRYASHAQTRAW